MVTVAVQDAEYHALLQAFTGIDWSNIYAQLVTAALAVLAGFFTQHVYERARRKDALRASINTTNVYFASITAVLEDMVHVLSQLVLPIYEAESATLDRINQCILNNNKPTDLHISFTSLPLLHTHPEAIANVPEIGAYPEILLFHHRILQAQHQFNELVAHKMHMIRNYLPQKRAFTEQPEEIQSRLHELTDSSLKLILCGESVLDTSTYTCHLFKEYVEQLKKKRKKLRLSKTEAPIFAPQAVPFHTELRHRVKQLLDQNYPTQVGRALWMFYDYSGDVPVPRILAP